MIRFRNLFSLLQGEEDKAVVLQNVKANVGFKGPTLWILACAILIASVGLNVNSTAVVIGAMLISPLMGPIVGAGFALGMSDFKLLRRSLINLLIVTVVSLLTASLYFYLTPFKEAQSELLARTSPNIYDVMIAFFGGLVGVIALTRVDKGNPIPGVAIATALMPPLCTAGYGLATGNWKFMGGALFLYLINCTFICLGTVIIVRFLRYPEVEFLDEEKKRRVRFITTSLTLLLIVPSIYFAYKFIQEQKFQKQVSVFLKESFEQKGNTLIFQRTNAKSRPRTIELAFLLRRFTRHEIDSLNTQLPAYGLADTRLIIRQDSSFLSSATMRQESENEALTQNNQAVISLQQELQKYTFEKADLFPEIKALFPEIRSFNLAKYQIALTADSTLALPVALYQADTDLTRPERQRLYDFLKVRLPADTLELYRRIPMP